MIESIQLLCFRNFSDAHLEGLAEGVNIVSGENASGKSSLVEALYFMSRGRSFRTHRNSDVVQLGEKEAMVSVGIKDKREGLESGVRLALAIPRRGKVRARCSREEGDVPLSLVAEQVPLQLVAPNSHILLEGSPEYRRQFVDWGVFHVEHEFARVWRSFNRILRQRNSALKNNDMRSAFAWDESFADYGERVTRYRRSYIEHLGPWLSDSFFALVSEKGLEWSIHQGWPDDISLKDQLIRNRDQDLRLGFTFYGPQRFDLRFRLDGNETSIALSRGQQKLFVSSMMLAQLNNLREQRGGRGILVVDDFSSELDRKRQVRFLNYLSGLEVQSVLTDMEKHPSSEFDCNEETTAMFHVKHGEIRRAH